MRKSKLTPAVAKWSNARYCQRETMCAKDWIVLTVSVLVLATVVVVCSIEDSKLISHKNAAHENSVRCKSCSPTTQANVLQMEPRNERTLG